MEGSSLSVRWRHLPKRGRRTGSAPSSRGRSSSQQPCFLAKVVTRGKRGRLTLTLGADWNRTLCGSRSPRFIELACVETRSSRVGLRIFCFLFFSEEKGAVCQWHTNSTVLRSAPVGAFGCLPLADSARAGRRECPTHRRLRGTGDIPLKKGVWEKKGCLNAIFSSNGFPLQIENRLSENRQPAFLSPAKGAMAYRVFLSTGGPNKAYAWRACRSRRTHR